jgi:hypothetical protein
MEPNPVCCHLLLNLPHGRFIPATGAMEETIVSNNANHNVVLNNIRHLDDKFNQLDVQQSEFLRAQTAGEHPDPNVFIKLLEKQSVTGTAMTAQFNLYQKPLKTVLTDSR